MTDLSHWDAAISFTAEEAAALVVGLDPSEPGYLRTKSKPIYERMNGCYALKVQWLRQYQNTYDRTETVELCKSDDMLESVGMRMSLDGWDYDEGEGYPKYLIDEIDSDFDAQRFTRKEMGRWLVATGIKSVYGFDAATPQITESNQVGPWPWGNHQTKYLGYLAAAAERWWKNYDPSDKTTAPNNSEVEAWLLEELEISSENKAKSIASMLRADDLPSGPHK